MTSPTVAITGNTVLVRLSIKLLSNSRKDADLTSETLSNHSLGTDAGKWMRQKLPAQYLAPVRKAAAAARQAHYSMTLPWEEGLRLLSAKAHGQYQDWAAEMVDIFQAAVEEFIRSYPTAVEEARKIHDRTFEPADYPSESEIRDAFGFSVEYEPMPAVEGWVADVAGDVMVRMRADLEARNESRIQAAVADTWERLLGPVQHLAERLASPDAVFRDTLVSNVTDILDLIPTLNITGDARLVEARNAIQAVLVTRTPEQLRSDPVVRQETAQRAAAVLARFGAVGVRKFAAAAESEAA